ncbi:hypothetical protein GLOTRDRAFT_124974 [Gloeophyllum trabeum ATCC 11539]|uniref:C2H2-type domain-containing protein n=1 Tax=Gloeophyllum trabeum (strain ATCC 11539 / FP-39264 / Madison 617) TaxID=670483 RepID=S7QPI5_GLOTA|nr:uncharacterized protein GLOTRDRAFT_124974 [Gloeophyllum trabeum ATCC 11539]EPQ61247.1 hypothetical protein GLOTRDRAFT_124974 [Gloeophyllum trabeum ATCC 11539]
MPPTLSPSHAHHYATQYIPRTPHDETYQIPASLSFLNGSSQLADHEFVLSAPPVPSNFDSAGAYLANQASSYAYSDSETTAWNDPRSAGVGTSDRIFSWNTQIQSNLHKASVTSPPSSSEIPLFSAMAIPLRSRPRSPSVPSVPAALPRRPLPLPPAAFVAPAGSTSTAVHDTRYTGGIPQQDSPAQTALPRPEARQTESACSHNSGSSGKVKEKKHGCWMCHKTFDRPSTLRKHLLVHTGEKAHACNICGRRFGVLSNLNRHVRRCAQKPVNKGSSSGSASDPHSPAADITADSASGTTAPAQSVPPSVSAPRHRIYTSAERSTASAETTPQPTSRKRDSSRSTSQVDPLSMAIESRTKRRRRAPSPSRWIPPSLSNFNLSHYPKSLPVPLPPVAEGFYNGVWEERNSYDENTDAAPYHPKGWSGKLPGPGLVGKDVSNTSALGKVLVF